VFARDPPADLRIAASSLARGMDLAGALPPRDSFQGMVSKEETTGVHLVNSALG
jgi:hypothetical protein